MMWSSDYPHHGNDWPYSRKVIKETMAGIPPTEKHQIVGGNAVRIFGLEVGARLRRRPHREADAVDFGVEHDADRLADLHRRRVDLVDRGGRRR